MIARPAGLLTWHDLRRADGYGMRQSSGQRILVIEDEPTIVDLVSMYLKKEGYRVANAMTGREGLRAAQIELPDLVILDLMLPDMDGIEISKRLRMDPRTAMMPIFMLTAKSSESDMVIGLELGADEYMPKPFSPSMLVARVQALFRRLQRPSEDVTDLNYGPIVMDLLRHEVKVGGEEVTLTVKEFGLLEHLLRYPSRVLTRGALLNAVWGYDYYGTTRTVDVHIRRLKQKIPYLSEMIISVKSLGYKLRARAPMVTIKP